MADIIQGTEEWFAARCGRATGSRFADILAKTKSGPAASRENYIAELVSQRLTGQMEHIRPTPAMQWGTDHEPEARMAAEAKLGIMVQEIGFIPHETMMAGVSPDGLIDDDGMIEIKCPNTSTHIRTLFSGMPSKHIAQVQGQLWIAKRNYCIFVSYDPRMPLELQLYTERIERDEKYIVKLEAEVTTALDEVEKIVEKLNELKRKFHA
jgi:putative phage-type endonuclease